MRKTGYRLGVTGYRMVCLLLLLFPVTCSLSPLYAQGSTPTRFNLGGFNDLKKIPKPTQYPDANHTRIYAKTGTDTVCVENNLGTEVCFAGISGTTNYLPKVTGATTLGDSLLSDDGTTLTYAGAGGASAASFTATGAGPSNITPAAVPGSPVEGDWGILAGSPDTFWFFNDTAVQYALTKPADLFGSSPAALLVTKAAGADPTTDNCVKWLAGGGVGDAGAACGGSSLGYIIDFRTTTSTSPADSTSYYFGNYPTLANNLPTGYADIDVPKACTAKRAEFKMVVSGTAATNENVTVDFWLNNATSFGSVTQQWDTLAHATSIVTGLTQALAAGDLIEVRIQTPAWATNPTNVHGWAQLYCE